MKQFFIYITVAIVFFSCDEPFKFDPQQAPERIVIDGLLTNDPGIQRIKITRSLDFYASGSSPRVTDAVVTVTDDLGEIITYTHNPSGSDDSVGYYFPSPGFAGEIGRTYNLRVEVDGEIFEASEKLLSVIPVDSLAFEADEEEKEDPEIEGRFYELLIFATEPQDEKNFYLFNFYRNDSLTFANETDIYYSDDELLAENIDGIPGPLYYKPGDVGKVEVLSLTRSGFVYYNDLSSLLNGDSGGMFGPIPASPRTNLSNDALGFFQVSAVESAELKLD